MTPFFPTIWNVLHDGNIDRIDGKTPGDVRFHVSIEYLRERFPDKGDVVVVTLHDCVLLSYRLYDAKSPITDLSLISNESATILNAEMDGTICRVFTDGGVLETKCAGAALTLDSGRAISLEELILVAKSYWDEWGRN